ncbi:MAG: SDR family NAD(P)-dependent oxidoreductase [Planctomycetes bacterium]|nr:SDR family NAD(P)-dependent oxidoreductase [Planctomycetota bacterium]
MSASPNKPRNAILTGAAGGLGRALAVRLAQDGWRLALTDLDEAGLAETLELVEAIGGQGECELLDVTDSSAWVQLRDRLQNRWPRLDLLVNNAGVCGAGTVGEFPLEDWQWILATNLQGPIYGCHTMVPWMTEQGGAAYVMNVASVAGLIAPPTMGAYNVAKAGLIALSETLYNELYPQGFGVTVVCPGFFRSNLIPNGRFSNERGREQAEEFNATARLTAAWVADRAVRAMYRRKLYVVDGLRARLLWRIKRQAPGMFHRLLSASIARVDRQLTQRAASENFTKRQ